MPQSQHSHSTISIRWACRQVNPATWRVQGGTERRSAFEMRKRKEKERGGENRAIWPNMMSKSLYAAVGLVRSRHCSAASCSAVPPSGLPSHGGRGVATSTSFSSFSSYAAIRSSFSSLPSYPAPGFNVAGGLGGLKRDSPNLDTASECRHESASGDSVTDDSASDGHGHQAGHIARRVQVGKVPIST